MTTATAPAPPSDHSNLLESFPKLVAISTPEQMAELRAAAAEENAAVLAATHAIRKNERVCGYIGLNSIPVTQAWLGNALTPRDSMHLLSILENLSALQGRRFISIFLHDGSPAQALLRRAGHQPIAHGTLFLKAT